MEEKGSWSVAFSSGLIRTGPFVMTLFNFIGIFQVDIFLILRDMRPATSHDDLDPTVWSNFSGRISEGFKTHLHRNPQP